MLGTVGMAVSAVRGRGDWIRTSDLLNPIQVRYQAALRPDRPEVPQFTLWPTVDRWVPECLVTH